MLGQVCSEVAQAFVSDARLMVGQRLPRVFPRNLSVTDGEVNEVNEAFPLRKLAGHLRHIATICRCDFSFVVGRIARCVANPVDGAVKAGRRI